MKASDIVWFFPRACNLRRHLRLECVRQVNRTLNFCFRACSAFYKGKKIAPLYMQSLVPRAIVIIEFGTEGDNQLFSVKFIFLAAHTLKYFSRLLNNFRAKIFGKIHCHALVYFSLHTLWIDRPQSHPVKLAFGFEFCNVL